MNGGPATGQPRWFRPVRPQTLALLRLLVGGYGVVYLTVRWGHLVSFGDRPADQFDPVGVIGLVTDDPLSRPWITALLVLVVVAGVAFTAGAWWQMSGPAFALGLLAVTTYRNSWGQVLHTENLVVLHTLVLAVSPAAVAWSVDARRRRDIVDPNPSPRWGWAVRVMAMMTVLTYLVAGVAKLRIAGWDWLAGDVLRSQVAHDNLRKHLLGDPSSFVGGWLAGVAWLWAPLSMATVAVELGAPLALWGRRAATVWTGLAWLFHCAVLGLMAILFPYHLLGLGLLPVLATQGLVDDWLAAVEALSRRGPARRAGVPSAAHQAGQVLE